MSEPSYVIGIDLGTTNSVAAYAEAEVKKGEKAEIRLFRPTQVVGAGQLDQEDALPSFILLPGSHDVPEGALALPWEESPDRAVGVFARDRGAELPHRLVSSAKSWLCHTGVDRTKPILPWGSPEGDGAKLSPVEASAAILEHIKNAWNHEMASEDEALRMENQEIVLTVPASFDAVARELTVKAAEAAGLANLTLLEEPQAAFYSWIHSMDEGWREAVGVGDRVLVCDVGGGTTDFSLITVKDEEGNLILERVAVGDHLLVGGDNMDLTLAHTVARCLAEKGQKLDAWQMRGLWQSCRAAKETLLKEDAPESTPVTVLGRGSGLIAGTVKTDLGREEIREILSDGFFPVCQKDDSPAAPARSGMRELGLIYEADPAITRHMAQFIKGAGKDAGLPTAVLFNGGVMKASAIRSRIMDVLGQWAGNPDAVRELGGADLDLAVARGAAYYGLARRGQGIRIKGGLAKTYYIGIEASMPAVPGMPAPVKALCVAPFGMEEGTELSIDGKEFGLVVGETVRFDFLGSSTRLDDPPGAEIEDWENELQGVTTLETTLDGEAGKVVPITIEVRVTEVGTLELWCVSADGDRWKLEFDVREREPGGTDQ